MTEFCDFGVCRLGGLVTRRWFLPPKTPDDSARPAPDTS
jgi:hypothetical protein